MRRCRPVDLSTLRYRHERAAKIGASIYVLQQRLEYPDIVCFIPDIKYIRMPRHENLRETVSNFLYRSRRLLWPCGAAVFFKLPLINTLESMWKKMHSYHKPYYNIIYYCRGTPIIDCVMSMGTAELAAPYIGYWYATMAILHGAKLNFNIKGDGLDLS